MFSDFEYILQVEVRAFTSSSDMIIHLEELVKDDSQILHLQTGFNLSVTNFDCGNTNGFGEMW